jgi:hypothetical protein
MSPALPYAGKYKVRTDKLHIYKVWCRHDALYWAGIVGEDLETRVAVGWYDNGEGNQLHAQPEVKILNTWYYFTMRPYFIEGESQEHVEMIIISMPKQPKHTWKKEYSLTWAEFAMVHNTWIIQKDGESFEDRRKAWSVKMNRIIKILREKLDD